MQLNVVLSNEIILVIRFLGPIEMNVKTGRNIFQKCISHAVNNFSPSFINAGQHIPFPDKSYGIVASSKEISLA